MLARLCLLAVTATTLSVAMPVLAKDKTKPAASDAVTCSGVYGPDSSEALVIETFGAENVVTGNVYGAEGMEFLATTVFPNDPAKSMQFGWWDEETRTGLSYVDLAPGQVGPLGLQLGQTPSQVAAINGEPFIIGGFWWDYGGYANIESGAIRAYPDCFISLRFSPMLEETGDIDIDPVAGEVAVPSNEPLLDKLDVRLSVLSLSYEGPEGDQ